MICCHISCRSWLACFQTWYSLKKNSPSWNWSLLESGRSWLSSVVPRQWRGYFHTRPPENVRIFSGTMTQEVGRQISVLTSVIMWKCQVICGLTIIVNSATATTPTLKSIAIMPVQCSVLGYNCVALEDILSLPSHSSGSCWERFIYWLIVLKCYIVTCW